MSMKQDLADKVRRKSKFHHGDLREALIAATGRLLIERGAENFSLADACRLAGVSTAAPYKHFRDKQEILQEIVQRAFEELQKRLLAAIERGGIGTMDGMIAMGHAYLDYAVEETAVFRFMFGQNSRIKKDPAVEKSGADCFSKVIEHVSLYCERQGVAGDAGMIALELWTFVHGAACLVIDDDYEKVAPGLDAKRLISEASPRLLSRGAVATTKKSRKPVAVV
jgi:AcrR family transcriptional regulator